MPSPGNLRRMALVTTDVFEEHAFRPKQSGNGYNISTVRRAIRCKHILCTNHVIVHVTL
jgi:hypothetical protein